MESLLEKIKVLGLDHEAILVLGLKVLDFGLDSVVEKIEKNPNLDIATLILKKVDKIVERRIESYEKK